MRFPRSLLALGLLAASAHVAAGYAYPVAPAGFSGSAGAWRYGGSAANAAFSGGVATSSVAVNVGGALVQVPAKMRLASNAASFVVAAARLNPVGLATGSIAAWLLAYGLEYANNQWQKTSTSYQYCAGGIPAIWGNTVPTVCGADLEAVVEGRRAYMEANHGSCGSGCVVSYVSGDQYGTVQGDFPAGVWGYRIRYRTNTNNAGWVEQGTYSLPVSTSGGTQGTVPAVEADWVAPAGETSISDAVANQAYPQIVLPVEPAINPSAPPAFLPQPLRVPRGTPEPIPGTSPQQYRQPITDIVPAPEPVFPWRVDAQPKWLENTDPVGITSPVTIDGGSPIANIPEEIKLETCGLPTTPPCKLDEATTPSDDKSTPSQTALEAARQAQIDAVTNVTQPSSIGWTFGVDLPSSSCSALSFPSRLGAFSVNMCTNPWVLFMRDLLAWLFGLGTALYIWRSANDAAGGR